MAALPKIPGMSCGEELLRTNFRKTQLLSRPDRNTTRPNWNADTFKMTANNTAAGTTKAISLDRKVLRFSCFWREGVHESAAEAQRVRKCIIYYFLEDDTIAVTEPKQDNSGIPGQGAFIKRHQIPRYDGTPYTFEDFNVGAEVTFYGKTFHVIDCDPFTRNFFEKLGVEVPEPETMPFDSYSTMRRRHAESNTARRGKQGGDGDFLGTTQRTTISGNEIAKTKQFLAHDKQVLRFYCMYDDRAALYGDVHLFTLHYFLADDTIEITETNPPNCGRDPFPSFVKRSKIPKMPDGEPFRNPNANMLFKREQVEYFTHADLRIGKKMSFYGRLMLIFNVDEFTRNFLTETYGITDFTPIEVSQPGPGKIPVEVPPHNGFGDEEDSLGSWKNLAVKPMKRDTKRMMENSTRQLKFQLQFANTDNANAIRKFVLTYFLADGTLSIFEPAQRNSGIIGGKFLNRQKVKKIGPDGKATNIDLSADDIYVGGEVAINQHRFRVIGTDERSLELMESDPELFPLSNVPAILTKIRRSAAGILQGAFSGYGENKMDYRQFATIVEGLELPLVEQEIMSVLRYFDEGDGMVDFRRFVDIVVGRR